MLKTVSTAFKTAKKSTFSIKTVHPLYAMKENSLKVETKEREENKKSYRLFVSRRIK